MDDLQIIALYFARDEKAIKETDIKYGKLCFNVANNILSIDQDAEECVNDTYLNVWNTIPPARPNHFMAFICKITRNLSLKKLEFKMALKRTPKALLSFDELESILPDNRMNPDIGNKEVGKVISDFLRGESEAARNVFIRKYVHFDSISDITARYSFAESKVKNLLYHSRKRLREYFREEGIEV